MTVIQTALNFPGSSDVQILACERSLREKLFSNLTYIPRYLNLKRLIFWMRSQNDFRSHSVVRTVFSSCDIHHSLFFSKTSGTVEEIKLFIDRVCPEIVNSIHDVNTGRLISVPLEKDFENYHGTKAYFDICDMGQLSSSTLDGDVRLRSDESDS